MNATHKADTAWLRCIASLPCQLLEAKALLLSQMEDVGGIAVPAAKGKSEASVADGKPLAAKALAAKPAALDNDSEDDKPLAAAARPVPAAPQIAGGATRPALPSAYGAAGAGAGAVVGAGARVARGGAASVADGEDAGKGVQGARKGQCHIACGTAKISTKIYVHIQSCLRHMIKLSVSLIVQCNHSDPVNSVHALVCQSCTYSQIIANMCCECTCVCTDEGQGEREDGNDWRFLAKKALAELMQDRCCKKYFCEPVRSALIRRHPLLESFV